MKNWKTTLIGILGAVSMVLGSGAHGWQQYTTAGMVAALGVFAKDAGVSGPGA